MRQFIEKNFSNHAETKEKHWDEDLKTHYYKTTKSKAINAVNDYFNGNDKFSINSQSVERGEMSVHFKGSRSAFIIVTIIDVKPLRTAIDFSVTTEGIIPMDLGFSNKLIKKLYADLNKHLEYVGSGLSDSL